MTRRWILGAALVTALLLAEGPAGIVNLLGETHARLLPKDRSQPLMYVALGDSGVAGVGASRPELSSVGRVHARLRSLYPEARLVNLGVAGAMSSYVARYQLPRALELQPDLVTILVGINDIMNGKDAQQFERNLETIFRTLNTKTPAAVVVMNLPNVALQPNYRARYVRSKGGGEKAAADLSDQVTRFNEALDRQARAHGVEVVDWHTFVNENLDELSRRRHQLGARDGFHASDEGYAIWADLIWQAVKARIP